MSKYTNILFIGDVVGKPGRKAITDHLPYLKEKYNLDFVVANAENSAGGFGISKKTVRSIFQSGVNVITLGDHTWDNNDAEEILGTNSKVLRPVNYPKGLPGEGFRIYTLENGTKIAVLNILGRYFMRWINDCPFKASRKLQKKYKLGEDYDILIIDSHTEATAESLCIGHIWDGKASMIAGSHTHIPTADSFITDKGTLYQTDTGMTGVYNTSLGSNFHEAVQRLELGKMVRLKLSSGDATLCGLYAKVDNATGKAVDFKAIRIGGVLPSTEKE